MLTEINDAIIEALEQIQDVSKVGEWVGEVEELMKMAQPTPSLHVVFAGRKYAAEPVAIGSKSAVTDMAWTVVLLSTNLRVRETGALEAYALIEKVHDRLDKHAVPGGWLWPKYDGIISARNGILGYGLDFIVLAQT